MTVRSVRTADTTTKERRKASGQRVHFEAMVAVGGAEGGAAFEAESVDVSSEGMRLRTAYLPGIGDRLVCRFDGPGTELVAIGEVTWASEQPKGGEFGLKFVELDPETEAALKELVAIDDVPMEGGPVEGPKASKVAKNARVKLHIEGLASPMKARVRDGSDKEVCVGSSLEFLKLGRQVEVEDVDAGERREGFVDGVKVEVDPSTSIPQLVVSLRFDAAMLGGARASSAGVAKTEADIEPAPVTRLAGSPPPSKRGDEAPKASKKKESTKTIAEAPTEIAPAQAATADETAEATTDDEDDEHLPPNKLRAAQERAKEMTTKAAAKIGPAFTKMGEGAKGMFASIKGTLDRRREARDEAKKANAPRRVTAPPPSGALTSEGRRVVRQENNGKEETEAPPSTPKRSRKGIVMGAAAGLALVLGVVGVTKALGNKSDAPAMSAVSSADAKKTNAQQVPPIPGAPATGDVPLFGPTPLSTTESVPPPPPAAGKKADAKADDGGGDAEPADQKSELTREWGNGDVKNAKAFTVKMDGPVEGFTAAEIDGGFSITIPKHQSLSSSSALVRKDKRLTAVDIENREDGAEVRMKFKGEPPGYKIKVRGDKIEIRLGEAGSGAKPEEKKHDAKKVASKSKDKKKTDKKPAPKKPAAKKP